MEVESASTRFSTTVDVSREDTEMIGINNLQKDYIFSTRYFLGDHFYFLYPMQDCKFKCICPMSDASILCMPYL